MDDDLNALRGGSKFDDDLFGAFTDPDDLGFDAAAPPPPPKLGGSSAPKALPIFDEDPLDFSALEQPTVTGPAAPMTAQTSAAFPMAASPRQSQRAAPASGRAAPRRRVSNRGFLGLTPLERMVLSILTFLDFALLGFIVLVITGAIQVPGTR